MPYLERKALTAPDVVARALSKRAPDARARWMLMQPREVRMSYATEALGADDRVQEIWMLRQPDAVRESYIRDVLDG